MLGSDPTDKGRDVWRSLRAVAMGSRTEMLKLLAAQQATRSGTTETVDDAPQAPRERPRPEVATLHGAPRCRPRYGAQRPGSHGAGC